MHTLKQMDPELYVKVLRTQAQFWDQLFVAFEDTLERWLRPLWSLEARISTEEILADLSYGRD